MEQYIANNPDAIKQDLRDFTGGKAWISKHKLRKWLGVSDTKVNDFVMGMRYRINGAAIEYFIGDIAEKAASQLIFG